MPETKSGNPVGPSVAEIYVFMNEYGFRVEPGFVVARPGDRLEFHNVTVFDVILEFDPELYSGCLRLGHGEQEGFGLPEKLAVGFHPYDAKVEIGLGQKLNALGGSGPGVIIRP